MLSETLRRVPYTYASRFEGEAGACPEELLAAAHAGCFNHAVANISGARSFTVEEVQTRASLSMDRDENGAPVIAGIHFTVTARIPGMTADLFEDTMTMAKERCAISRALNIPPHFGRSYAGNWVTAA